MQGCTCNACCPTPARCSLERTQKGKAIFLDPWPQLACTRPPGWPFVLLPPYLLGTDLLYECFQRLTTTLLYKVLMTGRLNGLSTW
eukprot:718409-Amphidinium_carterae.2